MIWIIEFKFQLSVSVESQQLRWLGVARQERAFVQHSQSPEVTPRTAVLGPVHAR